MGRWIATLLALVLVVAVAGLGLGALAGELAVRGDHRALEARLQERGW